MKQFHFILYLLWLFTSCNCISFVRRKQVSYTTSLSSISPFHAIQREDFPILATEAYPGKPLIFLDSAASSQKPLSVLQKMDHYYKHIHANVHRGAYSLATKATEEYEEARNKVKRFINAKEREEIVFTRGATEAINLVAMSYGQRLQPGDEIILSVMEHHSNMVPWQMLAQRTGAILRFVGLDDNMCLDMRHFQQLLSPKTKIVSVTYASNVLGVINPVKEIIKLAHQYDAVVMLDACQAIPHMPVDVQSLDVDFLAASSHKMCGPTGVGFLYGKLNLLETMPPIVGGGEMIDRVELEGSTYALPPARFEAGTPAIAEAIGMGEACEYLMKIGMENIYEHEQSLGKYLYEQLSSIPGLELYGPRPDVTGICRGGLVAFNSKRIHASDLSFFLDQEGVCVRTGHHCAQPLHKVLNISGSMRASIYFYNDKKDVDNFIVKLKDTIKMFDQMNLT